MWLSLAELRVLLSALEHYLASPPGVIDVTLSRELRDYVRDQVARVTKVADEWGRRKAEEEATDA